MSNRPVVPPGFQLPPLDPTVLMNNEKRKLIDQYVAMKQAYDQMLHIKAKDNLYVFNKYVMEVEKDKQILAPFHKELCNFVTDNIKKKKLILVPRGHLKSTLITIGYSLFRIINNPDIRILILNATWQMAVDFLTEIKRGLKANELLISLYGNLAEGAEEWSQDRITLKRKNHNIKGPTVWSTGVESNLVGSHPDLIIFDDVVNRDNTTTREQIDKVILRYKDALDLLEPGGQLIVIGTRWRQDDFYSWLMDKEVGIESSYDLMVHKAYEGNLFDPQNLNILWKEKFSAKVFQDLQREKGWYEFSAQYLNNPIPPENALFKKETFQYFDIEDIRGKDLQKVMLIDPAIAVKKDSDFTAMVVVGIDIFSNVFILDIVRGHFTPNEIVDHIFQLNEVWHPNNIGLETIAYQKALSYSIREATIERRKYLPITELKFHDQSKDQRIKGLQPLYENKRVFHRRNHRMTPYLEDELLSFDKGKHDDIIDALSFSLELMAPPRKKVNRYHAHYLY